jgi:uncharacterized membrane protein
MEKQLDDQFDLLFRGCLSNERPAELLLLWRRRIESMMKKEDIFFLGIYNVMAYMSHPMNLINDIRFLKIFCHLPLEKKIKKQPYDKNNFSLYQKVHSFDIFSIFDMYTFLLGMPPLQDEERYSILRGFNTEEKRYLMNNLYPDFSEVDFAIEGSFQFKAFEAFLATDNEFKDPPVIYSEYEKIKYLCQNCKNFMARSLISSLLVTAILSSFGFFPTVLGILINILFLQLGLFVDSFLFSWLYSRTVDRESVESCRRIWKRLHTFMVPLPPGKYVGALTLCVEEIKGKKHIEFKFSEDKYDQSLGQYYLSETQTIDRFLLTQYPNTGLFFWFSILSNVKITRRRIKINSYLSVEKFTPEFFLIDFQYFGPYTLNPLSRTLSLPALFELVKLTLESHFPNSQLTVISNGFLIQAPNTHTRIKISSVARYCLDKLEIGNSCNRTNRYFKLKEEIYNDLAERIAICKRDLESPMEFSAIAAMDSSRQLTRTNWRITKEIVTQVEVNPRFNEVIDFPSHVWTMLGMGDASPTLGWIAPYLDFEKRTLNVQLFDAKKKGFMRKRILPLVEARFDYYSGGLSEPMQKSVTTVKEVVKKENLGYIRAEEEFPELARRGVIHREITIAPICEIIGKISAPKKVVREKDQLVFESLEKKIENRANKKRGRLSRRSETVKRVKRENRNKIADKLVSRGMCQEDKAEYVAMTVNKLVEKRVRSAGILYKRINKKSFNDSVKVTKRKFRETQKNTDREYTLSRKLARVLKKLRNEGRTDSTLNQMLVNHEYIDPYIAHKSGIKLEADNQFKLFLLKRRLTDYGISWKRTSNILATYDIVKNRPHLNGLEIPNRLRNLMRNVIKTVPRQVC